MRFKILLTTAITALLIGCSEKGRNKGKVLPETDNNIATYFSMRDFVKDQWDMYKGQPYSFVRYITIDGRTDTAYVNAYDMDLGSIFETFIKTDISDKKYLGKYNFSVIDEPSTFSRSFYYEAIDPELYTKKLQITVDPSNNKIQSIFVEAAENTGWTRTAVKLYYAPLKVIQIQERKKSRISSAKEMKTEYRFP